MPKGPMAGGILPSSGGCQEQAEEERVESAIITEGRGSSKDG